jgi:hypothetical protein
LTLGDARGYSARTVQSTGEQREKSKSHRRYRTAGLSPAALTALAARLGFADEEELGRLVALSVADDPALPRPQQGRHRRSDDSFVVPASSARYERIKYGLSLIAVALPRWDVAALIAAKFSVSQSMARKDVDLAYEQLGRDQPPPDISAERTRYLATLDAITARAFAKGQLNVARLAARDRALCCGVIKSEPTDHLDRSPEASASLNWSNLTPAEAWTLQQLMAKASERPSGSGAPEA